MQILLIEDDRDLAANLIDFLEAEGHEVDYAQRLKAAETLLSDSPPELLICDRMLPDGDGLELVKRLRGGALGSHRTTRGLSSMPALFLTARDQQADMLDGFAAGADDYMVKPFSLAELGARVAALNRRRTFSSGATPGAGPLVIDSERQRILANGHDLALTPLQYRLLEAMIRSFPDTVGKQQLTEAMWGREAPASDSLKVQLHSARKKLAPIHGVALQTVRGEGIRLVINP